MLGLLAGEFPPSDVYYTIVALIPGPITDGDWQGV